VPLSHFGDGNVHYNISQPAGWPKGSFLEQWDDISGAVHAIVLELGGSISAEHGIGVMKRDELARVKDPVALDLMRRIKASFDPKGILNPGKVL
jgi:FAD/FMN-containing dehydrogenase